MEKKSHCAAVPGPIRALQQRDIEHANGHCYTGFVSRVLCTAMQCLPNITVTSFFLAFVKMHLDSQTPAPSWTMGVNQFADLTSAEFRDFTKGIVHVMVSFAQRFFSFWHSHCARPNVFFILIPSPLLPLPIICLPSTSSCEPLQIRFQAVTSHPLPTSTSLTVSPLKNVRPHHILQLDRVPHSPSFLEICNNYNELLLLKVMLCGDC